MSLYSAVRRFGVLFALVVLALAACGGDEDGAADQAPAATETVPIAPTEAGTETEAAPTAEPTAAPTPADAMTEPTAAAGGTEGAAGGAATVEVASTDLGDVLVDGEGMTLYLFMNDEQGGESTCYDDCEANWPPLVTEGDVMAGEELDQAMFSTVAREDGSQQVAYNGWPLYYFAGDSAAGDVNGQGVGDVWFAVTPSGEAVSS